MYMYRLEVNGRAVRQCDTLYVARMWAEPFIAKGDDVVIVDEKKTAELPQGERDQGMFVTVPLVYTTPIVDRK